MSIDGSRGGDAAGPETGLQIEIIDTLGALERIGSEWDGLFAAAGKPHHVFQKHAFLLEFCKVYVSADADACCSCRLAILLARRAGRLVLVWPLVEQRSVGARVVGWLGEPVSQYGDVLLHPGEDRLATLRMAYGHLLDRVRPDVVRLRRVREDADIAPFLKHLEAPVRERQEAPCITLRSGGSSFEDRQSGKARKNRRRLLRRLEERGETIFAEVTEPAAQQLAIASGLADKREWLARRALLSSTFADRRFDTFLKQASVAPDNATGLSLFTLSLDRRPIAVALGFRCKARLMLHVITYAAEAEKHGAGVLNLEAILRLAEAEGLEAVDLLPPKADYKLDWSDTAMEVADYSWGTSLRGRIWAGLLDGIARPRARQLIDRAPLAARRWLASRKLRKAQGPKDFTEHRGA